MSEAIGIDSDVFKYGVLSRLSVCDIERVRMLDWKTAREFRGVSFEELRGLVMRTVHVTPRGRVLDGFGLPLMYRFECTVSRLKLSNVKVLDELLFQEDLRITAASLGCAKCAANLLKTPILTPVINHSCGRVIVGEPIDVDDVAVGWMELHVIKSRYFASKNPPLEHGSECVFGEKGGGHYMARIEMRPMYLQYALECPEPVEVLSDAEVLTRVEDAVVSIFDTLKGAVINKKMCNRVGEEQVSLMRMRYKVADDFRALLVATGSWLTGSYVLQAITGDHYPDSDIDIFCPASQILRVLGFFHGRGGTGYNVRGTEIEYRLHALQGVIDIDFHGKKVQLISVDERDVSKYIDRMFDLSFCKARFDGVRVLPEDVTDICNRRGTLDHRHGSRSQVRVLKYEHRGYTISIV